MAYRWPYRQYDELSFEPTHYPNEGYVATREVLFEKWSQPKLIITSTPIGLETRKIRAVWTPQLTQDLEVYHSIDAEAELKIMLDRDIEEQEKN